MTMVNYTSTQYIYMLDTYRFNNKGRVKNSLEKYVPLTLFVTFACEWESETEQNCNILTQTLMAVCVVSFPLSRTAQPEAQRPTLLGDGFLYCILSATSLDPNTSGAPRAPSAWRGFPYHILSAAYLQLSDFLSWPSYIIVQRPLNRPLNLWNGMFDRHQAEITLMQFTGHSLPEHQSMSLPRDFFLPCSISSAKSCPRDFFRLLDIGMSHFLPVHHFGMA